MRRTFQQRLNDPVILSFAALPNQASRQAGEEEAGQGLVLQYSAVKAALPLNVHLLTLKALPEGSLLLRLAHLYQVSSSCLGTIWQTKFGVKDVAQHAPAGRQFAEQVAAFRSSCHTRCYMPACQCRALMCSAESLL